MCALFAFEIFKGSVSCGSLVQSSMSCLLGFFLGSKVFVPIWVKELASKTLGRFSLLGDSPPGFLGLWSRDLTANNDGHVLQRQYLQRGQTWQDFIPVIDQAGLTAE